MSPATGAQRQDTEARAEPSTGEVRRSGRRTLGVAVGVAALAAAAAAGVLLALRAPGRGGGGGGGSGGGGGGGGGEPAAGPVALATAPARSLEGRISYRGAAAHRPYQVQRAGEADPAAEPISLDTLARLERRGDLHGLAAAHLLLGDPARALATIDRRSAALHVAARPGERPIEGAGADPDLASDRALARLASGKPAEALVELEAILARAPDHPQARWNRALALRELALPLQAAEAFEAAAAPGEPGWADEAKRRAGDLAAALRERREAYDQMIRTGDRLAAAPEGIAPEAVRRFPGMARSYFYDAVRGAASAELVQRLAPLARELDALAGSDHLARHVARAAAADFARRGPLAARYAKLVAGERLDEAAGRAFQRELRASGPAQRDILLGALLRGSPGGAVPEALIPEYRELAGATGDPWLALQATEQEALALEARGEYEREEVALLGALAACEPRWIEFRCARLELRLAWTYVYMNRLSEADRFARSVRDRARRMGDWQLERRVLQLLANLESRGGEVGARRLAVARAYVGELARRQPEWCGDQIYGHKLVAMMLVDRPDLAGARRELDAAAKIAAACKGEQVDVPWAFMQAHVLRDLPAEPAEVAALRDEIAALRRAATPTERAVLDHTEGRLLIERDRAAATALLERAIAQARGAPPGDAEALRARSFSYAVLALDAARAGEWERVWRLLAEEAGIAPAARCALGVAIGDPRALAVIRDATGALHGHYEGQRAAAPAADDAALRALVPEALRARLAGCEAIEVVARAPIHGAPALFGSEVAWSYRSGRAPAAAAPPAAGGVLVIANTEPPALLGLPRLAGWRSRFAPDRIVEGSGATPSRALAELAEARYAELHVHGMVNAAVPDAAFLMMSPEADGRYALTAAMIRQRPLRGRPIVVLAACHAASTAPNLYQPWSLPAAFIDAGARAVIASTGVIDDADASAFFDDLRARLDRGAPPPIALRDARKEWLSAHPGATWVRLLMVFQ